MQGANLSSATEIRAFLVLCGATFPLKNSLEGGTGLQEKGSLPYLSAYNVCLLPFLCKLGVMANSLENVAIPSSVIGVTILVVLRVESEWIDP